MQLLQTVKASYEAGSYILDGCVCGASASSVALSLSTHHLRVYDAHTTTFVFDVRDHVRCITDVLSVASAPQLLYSCQDDGGVMLSDCRQGKAVHFVTDYSNASSSSSSVSAGVVCNSVAVTPSGNALAIALGGDVALLDTRMWREVRRLAEQHIDDITRLRFRDEALLCSASEDQMVLFTDTSCRIADDDDRVVQAINSGEVMTKMACHDAVAATTMIGSCENALVCAYDMTAADVRVPRADLSTYCVDWCVLGGHTLCLVTGRRDDDGNAGPLSVRLYDVTTTTTTTTTTIAQAATNTTTPTTASAWRMCERVHGHATLQPHNAHTELTRIALGVGDRLITGGEDGQLAFWSCSNLLDGRRCRDDDDDGDDDGGVTASGSGGGGDGRRGGVCASATTARHAHGGGGKTRVTPAGSMTPRGNTAAAAASTSSRRPRYRPY